MRNKEKELMFCLCVCVCAVVRNILCCSIFGWYIVTIKANVNIICTSSSFRFHLDAYKMQAISTNDYVITGKMRWFHLMVLLVTITFCWFCCTQTLPLSSIWTMAGYFHKNMIHISLLLQFYLENARQFS